MTDDRTFLDLFFERSEIAIAQTSLKYGRYASSIAYAVLGNEQDAEECVSDGLLKLWNAIPPQRPNNLRTFFGKITRNLALDRWAKEKAQKRGGGEVALALEELADCALAGQVQGGEPQQELEGKALAEAINEFLGELASGARIVFVRRYWYLESVKQIATYCDSSEAAVKTSLSRSRAALRNKLQQRGFCI